MKFEITNAGGSNTEEIRSLIQNRIHVCPFVIG